MKPNALSDLEKAIDKTLAKCRKRKKKKGNRWDNVRRDSKKNLFHKPFEKAEQW